MQLPKLPQSEPVERLTVSVKESTARMLDAYREQYLRTYKQSIEKSVLVDTILRAFMEKDKAFMAALDTLLTAKQDPTASEA